jgi:hypothetical protein
MANTSRRRISIHVVAELIEYVDRRAAANFRSREGELNAILTELQRGDSREASRAAVTPLFTAEQQQETKRGPLDTVSGYRGVYAYARKWRAALQRDGQLIKIGIYNNPTDAAIAYDAYVRDLTSPEDAAIFNFPRDGEQGTLDEDNVPPLDPETERMIWDGPFQADFSIRDLEHDEIPGIVRIPTEPFD